MTTFNPDDTTKPSRVNRKRKRRWRPTLISDLIKIGLTDCYRLPHNLPAITHLIVGRSNSFIYGINTPLTFAAFLCESFCTALCRHFIMAVCFGQSSDWLATVDQYCYPTTIRRPSRDKLDRWFIPFYGVAA